MKTIPTEPIGSIPRPPALIEAREAFERGQLAQGELDLFYDEAVRDTIECFEATGSPVITDGEQRKYNNFATYSVTGLPNFALDGFKLHFAAGHFQQWPRLIGGPFRYNVYADSYLDFAGSLAHVPLKQAIISPSAPFSEDMSTSRETAFDKIRARVAGTSLAAELLG